MLLYIGATFSLAGVTTKQIAATFAVDTAMVGYVFTLFSVGYSAAILSNGFLLERVDVGRETALAGATAAVAVAAAVFMPTLTTFAAAIFVYGFGLGVLYSVGYFIVVNLYDETARAVKVNMLNFFFGTGAVVAPILAGQAMQRGVAWQGVFLAALPLAALAAAGALAVRFPFRPVRATAANVDRSHWGAAVYVIGLALLCYVVSEMVFTYWLVTYLIDRLAAEVAAAGLGLSLFWAAMAAGRLAAGPLIGRLGVGRYIGVSTLVAFTAFVGLLTARTPPVALGCAAVMGAGYAGLFPTVLALGTQQVARPSPRLTTFFLAIGAGGGIVAMLLSSWLKQLFDVGSVLALAAALLVAMAALVWAAVPGRGGGQSGGGRLMIYGRRVI